MHGSFARTVLRRYGGLVPDISFSRSTLAPVPIAPVTTAHDHIAPHTPGWSPDHIVGFQSSLADWFRAEARDLPWRQSDDPYLIWMSEVLLQQTRVDQGLAYYEAFASTYPSVQDLASAPLDDILRLWEGLGYYARARNFHAGAKQIVRDHGGELPASYDDWLRVPGVGPYTAAAVASIGLGLPHAVVDGNVIRVLTRLFAIGDDVTSGPVKRQLQNMANTLLDEAAPGTHNEAMMELGAVLCTPLRPLCDQCPVQAHCEAFAMGDPSAYPFKKKKAPVPHHTIVVGIIQDTEGRVLVQRRPESAMLGGLWEFPGGKCEPGEELEQALVREIREETGSDVMVGPLECAIKHAYSHFRITMHAFHCRLTPGSPEPRTDLPMRWVGPEELHALAFPRANRKLIERLTAGSTTDSRR